MVQHLINTSAIWLLSLLVFDIFLRRESYHSYNRLYLQLTFLLGIFLPAMQWQVSDAVYVATVAAPVASLIQTKQVVVQAATIESTHTIDWSQWILIVYWTGVAISGVLLLKEVVILSKYFTIGTKTKDGNWRIVETGRQHGPFSVFRYIFIGHLRDYKPAELQMVLAHEKQHGRSLHFIDLLVMEIAKIIFWFHPCIYLFQKRLLVCMSTKPTLLLIKSRRNMVSS